MPDDDAPVRKLAARRNTGSVLRLQWESTSSHSLVDVVVDGSGYILAGGAGLGAGATGDTPYEESFMGFSECELQPAHVEAAAEPSPELTDAAPSRLGRRATAWRRTSYTQALASLRDGTPQDGDASACPPAPNAPPHTALNAPSHAHVPPARSPDPRATGVVRRRSLSRLGSAQRSAILLELGCAESEIK